MWNGGDELGGYQTVNPPLYSTLHENQVCWISSLTFPQPGGLRGGDG